MMARGRLKLLPSLTVAVVGASLLSLPVFTTPHVNAEETAPGARLADFDIDPLPGDGNKSARGVCSDGTTLWVVEERALKLYGYTLTDSGPSRKEAADIQLDVYENYGPGGCTSDGTTIWVADYELDKLVAYDIASAARVEGKDVDTLSSAGNNRPAGVASTDSTIWVADLQDKKLYAYALEDGSRDSDKDIPLHTQELSPVGLWTDGVTMWVADNVRGHFHVYALSTGARDATREFAATDTTSVQGIWSDGSVLWAANRVDRSNEGNKVLAYRMAAPLSSDASLSGLALSGVTLSPAFAAETLEYTASVAHEVAETTVTAPATEAEAQVTITPADEDDQAEGHQVNLEVGETVIGVEVTAADGVTTRTYSVTVTRAKSSDATLSGLNLSGVTLEPAFAAETLEYTASVAHGVAQTTMTTSATDADAKMAVTPADADDQADGHQVDLVVGETVIGVEVTAADGEATRTYSVTVTRAKSSNATLSALTLSSVTLSPAFAAETLEYAAFVGNEVAETTVTAVVALEGAAHGIKVDGVEDQDGIVPLTVGETLIAVVVTAGDGETTQTYSVTVTRAASSDASLSGLTLSGVTLEPAFAAATLGYTASVGNEVAETTVTATATKADAQVEITPLDADEEVNGHQVRLAVGETVIKVVVSDGETRSTYSVTVTRAKSSDTTLSALALKDDESTSVTLEPAFSGDHTSYSATVAYDVETLTVAAEPSDAEADINLLPPDADGERDGHQVALTVGVNVISIDVTAADGDSQREYIVRVTRQAAPNALLKSLSISDASLSPRFDSAVFEYAVELEHDVNVVTVKAVPADPDATAVIMLDGFVDGDGLIALPVGSSVIEVVATAKTRTYSRTYTIVVSRAVRKPAPLPTPVRSEDPPGPRPTPVRPTPTPTVVARGIGVSAAHIDLGVADTIDKKAQATLEVWNLGTGRMLLNFFDDAPWLSASPPFVVSTGPGDRQQVTLLADASFLGPGSHSAAFYVHADELDSRTTVSVTLTVVPRPTPTPTPTPAAAPTAIPTPMPLPELTGPASPVPTATPTRPEASNSPMPSEPEPTPTATPVEVPTPVPSPIVAVLVGSEESATHVEQLAETGLNTIAAAQQPTPVAVAVEARLTRTATVTLQYISTGRDTDAGKWVWTFFPGIILIDILAGWRLRRKQHLD